MAIAQGCSAYHRHSGIESDGLKERSNLLWHCRALGMATSQVGQGECLGVCAAAPTPMLKWASFRHPASHPVCA